MFPRRKANDHVSVTFLLSVFFSFFNPCPRWHDQCFRNFAFATYQYKFCLLLRLGYFVNGCVFTRVYVICKICEKLRRTQRAVDIC